MNTDEFKERYSPRFGDVIFSKVERKTSRKIRIAQAVSSRLDGRKEVGNYSHAAFVIDFKTIIHSVGNKGVHTVFLQDFFEKDMQFEALRRLNNLKVIKENATYYEGQKYDSTVNFIRRFAFNSDPEDTQVCSTLVAHTLVNFGMADITHPEKISPIKLYNFLKHNGWHSISDRYSRYLSAHDQDDEYARFFWENHQLQKDNRQSMRKSKKRLNTLRDSLISRNKLHTKCAAELGDEKQLKYLQMELAWLEQDVEIKLAFHDTDEKSTNLFRK